MTIRLVPLVLLVMLLGTIPQQAAAQFAPTDYYLISFGGGTTINATDDATPGTCNLRDALDIVNLAATLGPLNGCDIQQIGTPADAIYLINLPPGLVYTLNGFELSHTAHEVYVNGNDAIIQGAAARAAAYNVLKIDGFVGANSNWADVTFRWGLGVDVLNGATGTFQNVIFAEHDDSGLFFDNNNTPFTVTGATIRDNVAFQGGGINVANAVLTISSSQIERNRATATGFREGGGGVYMDVGQFNATNVAFNGNVSAGSGGGLYMGNQVVITGGRFFGNEAVSGGGVFIDDSDDLLADGVLFQQNQANEGGGVYLFGPGNIMDLNNSRFLDNRATSGGGVYLSVALGSTARASNTCFQDTDGGAVVNTNTTNYNFENNWWGAPSGPGGDFGGTGSAAFGNLRVDPVLTTQPPGCDTAMVMPARDYYGLAPGGSLNVGPIAGLLANDMGVLDGTARLLTPPDNGTATVAGNGAFTYTPDPAFSGLSAFEYEGSDGFGVFATELACIVVGDLRVQLPAPLVAEEGVPLSIPGLAFVASTDENANTLTATLSVENGVLTVLGGQDDLIPPLALRCGSPATVNSAPDPGPVVRDGVFSKRAPTFAPPLQAPPNEVLVSGNGTNELTVRGTRANVNLVLDTLTYTPNSGFTGVDQIIVRAEDSATGDYAHGQITVRVDLRDDNDGGGIEPEPSVVIVDETGTVADPSLDLGDVTLRRFDRDRDAPIYADVPQGVIANGDVFVRLIVFRGEYLVDPGEIGDDDLVDLGIETAAEVFGLTFGGTSVSTFDVPVRVCLLGTGTFYFRDATQAPRTTVVLPTTFEGGYTCASISASGTVILVPGTDAPPEVRVEGDAGEVAVELTDCMVTTNNIINLREGPSDVAAIIRPIPFNVTLTAVNAAAGWFEVDYLGTFGWVSAGFVTTAGACG